ncbi:MAG: SDR family oxidoreductase [Dehalococcoidia bacterium]|nr:SDR family oxidoreductase [Dehalococcoidia bacterium]
MNIVITGGAGFVGSHLAEALLAAGHSVVVLDNLLTGRRVNIAHLEQRPRFEYRFHDVCDPLPDLPCDALFHMASPASPEGYGRHPIETMLTNSQGTLHALQLAQRHNARFLVTSTSEVYGDPKEHPQSETYWGNVNPVGPRSCYDEGKRYAEALTYNYSQVHRLDARIVRIFNTYGPRNSPEDGRVVPNFITQALRGQPLTVYGDGRQTRSFCYVADLVEGLQRALFTAGTQGEVINLGNPAEFTVLELANLVVRVTGSRSEVRQVAARPEEIAQRRPDISKAKRLLGWEPAIALDDGLARTAAWLGEELGLKASAAER